MFSPCGLTREVPEYGGGTFDTSPCAECGSSLWSSIPPGGGGWGHQATYVFPALTDASPETISGGGAMATWLASMPITDLLRVVAASGHELLHRKPGLDVRELAAHFIAAVEDAHRTGMA